MVVDSHDWDLDILRGDLGPHPVQKLVELLNRKPLRGKLVPTLDVKVARRTTWGRSTRNSILGGDLVGLHLSLVGGVALCDIGGVGSIEVEKVLVEELEPVLDILAALLSGLVDLSVEFDKGRQDELLEIVGEGEVAVTKVDALVLDGLERFSQGSTVVSQKSVELFVQGRKQIGGRGEEGRKEGRKEGMGGVCF